MNRLVLSALTLAASVGCYVRTPAPVVPGSSGRSIRGSFGQPPSASVATGSPAVARVTQRAEPPRAVPTVLVRTDDMTNQTWIEAGPMEYLVATGKIVVRLITIAGMSDARIAITSASDDGWEYLNCHTIDANVDGRALVVGDADHDGEGVSGTRVVERVEADLGADVVYALSIGQVARLRICNDVFTLLPDDQAALREFRRRAWPEAASAASWFTTAN